MKNEEKIYKDVAGIEIKYREKINLPREVKFGTEIEFEEANYDDVSAALQNKKQLEKWLLKKDISVYKLYCGKEYGGEIISPILHDTKKSWKELKSTCNLIKKERGYAFQRSGAHIHVDSGILKDNESYIFNFIKLWMAYEHVIYRFAYGNTDKPRETLYRHASPIAPYIHEFLLEYNYNKDKIYKRLNGLKLEKECKTYYLLCLHIKNINVLNDGLNFGHCKGIESDEINTIEIRCPNGTLNHITWQNNINFFTKMLLYCASDNFDSELINKKVDEYQYKKLQSYSDIYLDDAIELSNLVFDNELDKMYFLKQYLKIYEYNFGTIKEKSLKR